MAIVTESSQSQIQPQKDPERSLRVVEARWNQVPQAAREWADWDWADQTVFLEDMGIAMVRVGWLVEDEQEGRLTPEQLARWHDLLRFIHAHDATLMALFEGTVPKAWTLPPLPAEVV